MSRLRAGHVAVGGLSLLLQGCVSASLASNTGPKRPEARWSTASRQQVHVGETVEFDFVLRDGLGRLLSPTGVADYCAATFGDDRLEVEPDASGHCRFRYRFERLRADESLNVRASAYAQAGGRDHMRVRGRWMKAQAPPAEDDRVVARDALRVTAYQTLVELYIRQPPDELDADSGVLRIRKLDGTSANVYVERPGRPGFSLSGPDPRGFYVIRYRPTGDQLNPTGTTDVEFVIDDVAGRRHRASTSLATP